MTTRLLRFAFGFGAVMGFLALARGADTNTNTFGFTGPEIFPIDPQISQLHVADLDGDGQNDVIIVNNARSRINILYNQTGRTNLTEAGRAQRLKPSSRTEMNELPPDARFRIE